MVDIDNEKESDIFLVSNSITTKGVYSVSILTKADYNKNQISSIEKNNLLKNEENAKIANVSSSSKFSDISGHLLSMREVKRSGIKNNNIKKSIRTDRYGNSDVDDIAKYTQQLSVWVANHLPSLDSILYKNSTYAVIKIFVQRDGEIKSAGVYMSSGYDNVDYMLVDSIIRSAPLPPVPSDYMKENYVLGFLVPIYLKS